ncbi:MULTISPECIES: ABC transporter permease [Streptomyces]|uniref:ABC transporter permease n=2 Tax=Streptomyces TaxID=1883 RepID=A0A3R7I1E0_9ACTN|nr:MULTISPECIES: ABC transporter permease [Streptomyces]KNE80349.1 ABC transporter permease [Streptomyces fradiae]OFA57907.1 ABC transporter permease [Streptomyces fradiae]PQM23743.1 ABC transporter permease [Streptomyces xinghaiensis]RKM91732.1 ABC transporter permease [Streptomyces xinghaiensis]RNC73436.1 ABC transporter permease [Streptomyces xinghaiensis]
MSTTDTPPEAAPALPTGAVREDVRRTRWQRHGATATIWATRTALLVVMLVLWQAASGRWIDDTFISRPSDIVDRLGTWWADGTLADNTWITVQEIVYGFLLGAAAGALAGYLLGASRFVYRVLDPFIMALYAIPKVALAPLFIVWIGIGMDMKVLLAAVTVFFLVFLNTAAAVREVDQGLVDAVRLMGGGRRQIALKVVLPSSMAGFLTGLKVSVPYALIGAVIGELVASNRGLGYLINDAAAQFDTAGVFATLVVLSLIAGALNILVGMLDRRVNRWKPLQK